MNSLNYIKKESDRMDQKDGVTVNITNDQIKQLCKKFNEDVDSVQDFQIGEWLDLIIDMYCSN